MTGTGGMDIDTRPEFPWPWVPVKRRKWLDDVLFEEGNQFCNSLLKQVPQYTDSEAEEDCSTVDEFHCQVSTCRKVFNAVAKYEVHYHSSHRNTCCQCHRSFPTNHLLDVHIQECHDTLFQLQALKQNMYQCLVETCVSKFKTPTTRRRHLVEVHKFPSNFRFDRKPKTHSKKKSLHEAKASQHGAMAISGCDGDHPVAPSSGLCTNGSQVVPSSGMECDVGDKATDDMEVATGDTQTQASSSGRFTYSYKVPATISFGHGASRAFHKGKKKKGSGKHWHQQSERDETHTVDIENVDMADLGQALDTT